MHSLFKCLGNFFLIFYYWIIGIFKVFVPRQCFYKNVDGEVVLITGGGSGIGRLIAKKFASKGAHVVIWDINESGCKETAEMIRKNGGQVTPYFCDITDRQQVYSTAAKVKDEVGIVSILVNNAGIVCGKSIVDIPDHMVEKTFNVNAISQFWTLKAFLPDMFSRDHGHIVAISSLAGLFGTSKLADYCGSKAAVIRTQETVMFEAHVLGLKNVHTTTVCPYFTNTGLFEGAGTSVFSNLEPEYVAEEVVAAVLSNEPVIYRPRIFYFINTLITMLPIRSLVAFSDCLGGDIAMDNFTGRKPELTSYLTPPDVQKQNIS